MEALTTNLLCSLIDSDRLNSTGFLPELVKRLILTSANDISRIRIPSKDDVWTPGFDGFVISEEESQYVSEGQSVWEFGISKDYVSKVNQDYKKRSDNPNGIDKQCTTFYLVIPRLWNAEESIPTWEEKHKGEWKRVHIIDASELCDWINSIPSVCCWLFENYCEESFLKFTSVNKAWEQFCQKTNPNLHNDIFLLGRESESNLLNQSSNGIIRVRSHSFLDAIGFILSSTMQHENHKETFIVVEDKSTYEQMNKILKDQTFILTFPYADSINLENNNSVILGFGKEDISIKPDIELKKLSKTDFENSLKKMGIEGMEALRLVKFTDRNISSLLRNIPGNINTTKPHWVNQEEDLSYMIPLLFLRKIDKASCVHKYLIELFCGNYRDFENRLNRILKLEDSPIKLVDRYYSLNHYEELWNILSINTSDSSYSILLELIIEGLRCHNGKEVSQKFNSDILSQILTIEKRTFSSLLTNLIYFASVNDNERIKVIQDFRYILEEMSELNCRNILIDNLSLLANVSPKGIVELIKHNMTKGEGFIDLLFAQQDYSSKYCNILWTLETLLKYDESKFDACIILKELHLREYRYSISNSPRETLLNALCLLTSDNALLLKEKQRIILKFIEEDPIPMGIFSIDLISKDHFFRSLHIEEFKSNICNEVINYTDLYTTINEIILKVIEVAIKEKSISILRSLIKSIRFISLENLNMLTEQIDPFQYDEAELNNVYFEAMNQAYWFKRMKSHEKTKAWDAYITEITKFAEKIKSNDLLIRYSPYFRSWWDCPMLYDIEDDIDYKIENQMKFSFRQDIYNKLKEEYPETLVDKLIPTMSDDFAWGMFLLTVDNQIDKKLLCDKCIEFSKYQILVNILDSIDYNVFTSIFTTYSNDIQLKLLASLNRIDVNEVLDSEDKRKAYWGNKTMYEYVDEVYKNLCKYNPLGLLYYYTFNDINMDNLQDIVDVICSIEDMGLDIREISSGDYYLNTIFSKIDTLCYLEEIAKLEFKFYAREQIDGYLDGMKLYYFYNPSAMSNILNDKTDFKVYFDLSREFSLPTIAYDDYNKFEFFFEQFIENANDKDSAYSISGQILGRTILGRDKIFPHEFARRIIEKYSNESLNNGFVIGKMNSVGVRVVGDGSDQKSIALELKENANTISIDYPITARLLRRLSDYHMKEAQRDLVLSEIDLE